MRDFEILEKATRPGLEPRMGGSKPPVLPITPSGMLFSFSWLPDLDLNQERVDQNHLCYRLHHRVCETMTKVLIELKISTKKM